MMPILIQIKIHEVKKKKNSLLSCSKVLTELLK